jgi:hypothetical protein
MQFWSSAVQMVGRLFGNLTTTSDGVVGPLTGIVVLITATLAAFSFAAAAAWAFAVVCF